MFVCGSSWVKAVELERVMLCPHCRDGSLRVDWYPDKRYTFTSMNEALHYRKSGYWDYCRCKLGKVKRGGG